MHCVMDAKMMNVQNIIVLEVKCNISALYLEHAIDAKRELEYDSISCDMQ
jgi:hypothetical protein